MNRWLVAVALLSACGDKQAPLSTATQPALAPPVAKPARQLVTAIVDSWDSTQATLQLWTRVEAEPWQRAGDAWPAVVGHTGTAWGTGLHADPGRPGPRKKEGDGKSPAGMFSIRGAYGYTADPPAGSKLAYTTSDKLECVDDPSSPRYAQIVDTTGAVRDWKSSEQMRRDDELHTWVVDLAHNPERTPGGGSCIFLHVWSGPQSTTVGCTAMDKARLAQLLRALDPAEQPVFVLLPRGEYQALAVAWDLPPL